MKNLLLILLVLSLFGCKDNFSREKYDVSLYFENATQTNLILSVTEVNNKIKWTDKEILPNESFTISFNIKKDIGIPEGGFVYKAYFSDGDSTVINTGYFTNYQFQGKNPAYYKITKSGFEVR